MLQQSCRVCNSLNSEIQFTIDTNRFVRCRDCHHVFLDQVFDEPAIKKVYESYWYEEHYPYFQGVDTEVLHNIDGYLSRCKEYCPPHHTPLKLLDIGCGTGILLERAAKQGFRVEGIEICEPLAQAVKEKIGCQVYSGSLRSLRLPEESFDVVTMYDLLEHLWDPVSDVKIVHKILKHGGLLFILTPNEDALIRKLSKMAFSVSCHLYDKPLKHLYYPQHLSYFTRRSLLHLLKDNGFETVLLQTRNQELGRLNLSPMYKFAVRVAFWMSRHFHNMGGKLIAYARKSDRSA